MNKEKILSTKLELMSLAIHINLNSDESVNTGKIIHIYKELLAAIDLE